mmetsp:Transcript_3580/g.4145  ORF Transcript_3580/g.4145 Transcript_3580/m.4145 type:complete len:99 (+) Transcript_3580:320-616(+)
MGLWRFLVALEGKKSTFSAKRLGKKGRTAFQKALNQKGAFAMQKVPSICGKKSSVAFPMAASRLTYVRLNPKIDTLAKSRILMILVSLPVRLVTSSKT